MLWHCRSGAAGSCGLCMMLQGCGAQVIQGIPTGRDNATTMVAILSRPAWNASAQTLTFSMQPVQSAVALKLRDGAANGAFAAGRDSADRAAAVGMVLRDVVVYVDDSSADRGAPSVEVSARMAHAG